MKQWLMQLWELTITKICGWQGGGPGAPMVQFQSESKSLRTRESQWCSFSANTSWLRAFQFESKGRGEKTPKPNQTKTTTRKSVPQLKAVRQEELPLTCGRVSLFYCIQAFNWLDKAWERGQSAVLSLLIPMLILSKTTSLKHPEYLTKYLGPLWRSQVDT